MKRLVAIALLVLAAAPAARAAEPAFTTMPMSRFGGGPPGAPLKDVAGKNLGGRAAKVSWIPVRVRPSRQVCGAHPSWLLDGQPVDARPQPRRQARGICDWTLVVDRAGAHRLTVDSTAIDQTRTFTVDDRLVVTLGDSVASGEGNPRRRSKKGPDRVWLDRRCHRSAFSGFELAARRVARRNEETTSITFVNFACSGATIAKGILGPYRGIEAVAGQRGDIPSQLSRLDRIVALRGTKPDALMVSVGANDVRFGDVVVLCASKKGCARGKLGPIPASEALPDLLAHLRTGYDNLAVALTPLVQRPRDVLLTEYFNPTRDRKGELCQRSLGFAKRRDVAFAESALLLPLNEAGRSAARRSGFSYVAGIKRRFTRHGYCAGKDDRWVVRISESLLKSAGSPLKSATKGTMHPNRAGHEAIADELAPKLAKRIGVAPPRAVARPAPTDPEALVKAKDDGRNWWLIGALVLGALLVFWLLVRTWFRRVTLLMRPSGRAEPVILEAKRKEPERVQPAPAWLGLVQTAAKALGGVVSLSGLVLFLGGTILWVRFAAVGAPAGQAVNAAGKQEWLVTGWHALILFVLAGLLAVLITYVLDPDGTLKRPTRRGLGVVVALELLVAIAVGEFRWTQAVQLAAGFLIATVLLHLIVDRAVALIAFMRKEKLTLDDLPRLGRHWLFGDTSAPVAIVWRAIPVALLIVAIAEACIRDGDDRWLFIGIPLVVAALLFTAPGAIAGNVTPRTETKPVEIEIETPRVLLSGATVACLTILLGRDEVWLLAAAGVALLLALMCLFAASASGRRFAPYATAVAVSVPLYGAALFSIRAYDRPELQPFAAIGPDGKAVCGVYVGRTDNRIWYAEVDLRENVPTHRTIRLRGRLASVPDGDDTVLRVAPLQPLADAQPRAVRLRDELLAERGQGRGGPTCDISPSPVQQATKREQALRRIADRTAPDLLVAKNDQFPPTSVLTMFSLRDRRSQICRHVDANHCLRLRDPGDLPWNSGLDQYLDYPASPTSTGAQRAALLRSLPTADPEATAMTYYLVSGRGGEPLSVQHWFYFPFNYQDIIGVPGVRGGFHEGDFESIGVLLSKGAHHPRYVWMARHDKEGRVFGWNETALEVSNGHVVVHTARGSHASYDHCGRQPRPVGGGKIDDIAPCSTSELLDFEAASTNRADLARAGWGCWHGRFGQDSRTVIEHVPELVNRGPLSPLWQQSFGGVDAFPCRGVKDPGNRQGPAEAVLSAATAARLRERAGRLTPLVDDCNDWMRPALEGVILVACNERVLNDYVDSGFTDPGPERVRIARPDDPAPRSKVPDVPAVQRDYGALRPAEWRMTTERTTRMTVYVSCKQGRRTLEGRFENATLRPGRTYRVDDRGPEVWQLRSSFGDVVAEALPVVDGAPAGSVVDCSAQPRTP